MYPKCIHLVNWHPAWFNCCIYTWPGLKINGTSMGKTHEYAVEHRGPQRVFVTFSYDTEDFWNVPIGKTIHLLYLLYFWSTHTTRAISMFVTSVSYPLHFLQKSFVDLSWNYQKTALDTLFNLQILYLFKIPPVMPWLIFSLHSIFVCQAEYLVSSSVVDV